MYTKIPTKNGEYADGIIQMPIGCEARQGEAVDGVVFSCYDSAKYTDGLPPGSGMCEHS